MKRPITTTRQARKARSAAWARITGEVADALLEPYSRWHSPADRRTAWLAGWAQLKEGRGAVGVNDAAEMLEVAKIECGRLEREVADLTKQRDASRAVNAEFLAVKPAEVLVEGSYFRADEFPAILGNYMRLSVANSSAMKAGYLHTERMRGQRDAAYATIAAVQAVVDDEAIPDEVHGDSWVMVDDLAPILAKSTADTLAEHDREVAATALDKARDRMMPPLNWNLEPATGQERPGTANVDEVYADVYREMSVMATEYRDPPLATAHTDALRDTSEHYAKRPMPDGEGE